MILSVSSTPQRETGRKEEGDDVTERESTYHARKKRTEKPIPETLNTYSWGIRITAAQFLRVKLYAQRVFLNVRH